MEMMKKINKVLSKVNLYVIFKDIIKYLIAKDY